MKNIEENKNKKGLGRGIGSLLGTPDVRRDSGYQNTGNSIQITTPQLTDQTTQSRIWQIPVEKLKPSPYQPRQMFNQEELEELSNSIKQKGILQPIVARKSGESYEIIAGERRWRAAQMAGLHDVPVIIKEFDDLETLELAIIENIQRSDLNPIEEAEAYQRLATQFELSQAQIAEKVGKDRATVANSLRLLQLPSPVREMLQKNQITQGHAKVLLGVLEEKEQLRLAKKIVAEGLSVRKLEALIKNGDKSQSKGVSTTDKVNVQVIQNLQDHLSKKLSTKVDIQYEQGKGKISIHFYQKEQFNNLIENLLK